MKHLRKVRTNTGLGLICVRAMKVGDFVAEYSGVQIPTSYADTLTTKYLFQIDENWTIDGSGRDNIARYINHSCSPNCEARILNGRIFIFATDDIIANTELTIDYGDEYFNEFIKPFGCKCMRCMQNK